MPTYEEILKKKPKKKKLPKGWQEVPMDLDKINASLENTRKG